MSRRRHLGRRWPGVAALAALAVAVVGAALPVEPASASRLDVRAQPDAIVARSACTSTPVQVVPTTTAAPTAVRLDGLTAIDAAACAGADVQVTLFGSSGVLGTAGGSLTSTSATYALVGAVVPSEVTRVRVLVDGFAIPATWRAPQATARCEVRNADGSVDTSWSCRLTVEEVYDWHPWLPVEQRFLTVQMRADTSHPTAWQLAPGQYVWATAPIPETNRPANWETWSRAAVTRVADGTVVSRCAALPVVEVTFTSRYTPVQMDVAYDWAAWAAAHPGAVRYCD